MTLEVKDAYPFFLICTTRFRSCLQIITHSHVIITYSNHTSSLYLSQPHYLFSLHLMHPQSTTYIFPPPHATSLSILSPPHVSSIHNIYPHSTSRILISSHASSDLTSDIDMPSYVTLSILTPPRVSLIHLSSFSTFSLDLRHPDSV